MDESYKTIRRDFVYGELLERDITAHPLELLLGWYDQAVAKGIPDVNAMSLSTIDRDGYAVSRIVLLRDANNEGLSFFTNYNSAKGLEIDANPKGAVQFYWHPLDRQVRIRGIIEKVPEAESDAYFATRPRESQIGAWASHQSEILKSRSDLEQSVAEYTSKFANEPQVSRPPHWGGYRLVPDTYEFWQGRPSRLHDRMIARLTSKRWEWNRLSP